MKILLKETVEHYHIVDLDDYDTAVFVNKIQRINPKRGFEEIKDLIDDLQRLYGVNVTIHENGAGQETTSIEVVDEYEE